MNVCLMLDLELQGLLYCGRFHILKYLPTQLFVATTEVFSYDAFIINLVQRALELGKVHLVRLFEDIIEEQPR